MSGRAIPDLRSLEGQRVCLALSGGGRIDDCQLVSAAPGGAETLWVFANGQDTFVVLVGLDDRPQ